MGKRVRAARSAVFLPFCCRRAPLVGAGCGQTSAAWKSAGSDAFVADRLAGSPSGGVGGTGQQPLLCTCWHVSTQSIANQPLWVVATQGTKTRQNTSYQHDILCPSRQFSIHHFMFLLLVPSKQTRHKASQPPARCYNAMNLPHAGISWLADSALAAWRLLWLASASPLLSAVESSVLAAPGDSCPSTEPGRPVFQAEPPLSHPPISQTMHMWARVHSKHRQPAAMGCGNSRYKD